jgi:hypothetical protein
MNYLIAVALAAIGTTLFLTVYRLFIERKP